MSFRLCNTAKLDLASALKEHRSVSHSTPAPMSSTAWNIPENWEEASSLWFLMGDKLAKVPTCPVERYQLRVPHPNHPLISDMWHTCTAGKHKTPPLTTSHTCCLSKRSGKHAGEPLSFSSQAHPKDSEGSTVHFTGKTWWKSPNDFLPNLHNCRV